VGCGAGLALAGVTLYRARDDLASILPFAALGVLAFAGLAAVVNLRSYLALVDGNPNFAQGRYLLPAVAALGAAVVAAALAFGRHRGLVAATAIVSAIAWLNAFSLGLVLVRFYT
jgi:hypothetical protein